MYGYGGNGFGMGYAMGGLGWIWMVLVWILVIAAVAALIKWLFTGPAHGTMAPPPHRKPALAILEERYARGEIDKEEFESKRKDLR